MSQIEHHSNEIAQIELELKRKMIALNLDWHDTQAMAQLAAECKVFGPEQARVAFASGDHAKKARAELFSLASLMMQTMENATLEGREVHGGEVWKAFGRHLYE